MRQRLNSRDNTDVKRTSRNNLLVLFLFCDSQSESFLHQTQTYEIQQDLEMTATGVKNHIVEHIFSVNLPAILHYFINNNLRVAVRPSNRIMQK